MIGGLLRTLAFLGSSRSVVSIGAGKFDTVDGNDLGLVPGAATEALLDNEVAGGLAPGAKIYYSTAANTDLSDGLFTSILRAIDDNAVAILSISFRGL